VKNTIAELKLLAREDILGELEKELTAIRTELVSKRIILSQGDNNMYNLKGLERHLDSLELVKSDLEWKYEKALERLVCECKKNI